jgi:hypothetical protein
MIGTGNHVSYLGLSTPSTVWAFKHRCDATHIKRMLCSKKNQDRHFMTYQVSSKVHRIDIDSNSQLLAKPRRDVHIFHTDLVSAMINELKYEVPMTLISNVECISDTSFRLCVDNAACSEDLEVLTTVLQKALPNAEYFRLMTLEKTFSNV